ncbi:MaoC family dehydratase N-terminal domain-containing protein [Ectobacillus ponti]|uniref:MaoC family dehydratase N-terminal domain-containing protein n=1 Tax=Ectobacillus ponti TaxID=2961894 RepID=A0AA42BNT5_9BACI|nr:MaoC family dehydratase N-terminal domain-containing protein [Ectobacillus ponti]MCP8967691.1 MaoC family dehydratase N-terminal domain-containing protein [Ectobacillus ponti]
MKTEPVQITLTQEMMDSLNAALGTEGLPPTLPFLFWKLIEVPWLQHAGPIIHGEQSFIYRQPLQLNQTYTVVISLTASREKGNRRFLYHELEVRDTDGCVAAICSSTFIVQGEKS